MQNLTALEVDQNDLFLSEHKIFRAKFGQFLIYYNYMDPKPDIIVPVETWHCESTEFSKSDGGRSGFHEFYLTE